MNSLRRPSSVPTVANSGVTRLQILLFLFATALLTVSLAATCLCCFSGRPLETVLGLCGVAFSAFLQKEGKRRWNFQAIEAAADMHTDPAYYLDGEADTLYRELLEILAEVESRGWENLPLEDKVDYRRRVEDLISREPRLEDFLQSSNTVENLKRH